MKIVVSVSGQDWGGKHRYMLDLIDGLTGYGYTVTVVAESGGRFAAACRQSFLPLVEVPDFAGRAQEARDVARSALDDAHVLMMTGRHDLAALGVDAAGGVVRILIRHSAFPLGPECDELVSRLDAIVATSEEQRRRQFGEFEGIAGTPSLLTLLSGVSRGYWTELRAADAIAMRASLGIPKDARVLVSASRLSWEKGLASLLPEILQMLPGYEDVHFIIAGEGPERGALEALIAESGCLSRIHMVGHVEDVAGLLNASDVLLFSSTVPETGPLIIKEAMAGGLAIVASDVGGVSEFLNDESSGYLVNSWAEMAAVARRLLDEPSLRATLGQAARESALENHRFDERVRALAEELDSLCLQYVERPAEVLDDLDWDDVRLRKEPSGGYLFVPRTSQLMELTDEQLVAVKECVDQEAPPRLDPDVYMESRDFLRNLYQMGALIRRPLVRAALVAHL